MPVRHKAIAATVFLYLPQVLLLFILLVVHVAGTEGSRKEVNRPFHLEGEKKDKGQANEGEPKLFRYRFLTGHGIKYSRKQIG